jgi:tetratricopeptide (TPR) repeat protein
MGAAIASSVGGAASELSIQKGRLLRYQGVIARLRKDPDRAKKILAESYEIFTSSSEKLESARTLYELGLLARDQGDILRSQSLFDEARLLFTQIGAEKDIEKVGALL